MYYIDTNLSVQIVPTLMEILIKNIINSTIAAFHEEGLAVYSILEKAIAEEQTVEISFVGINRVATQFLNASIGKAYLLSDPAKVDQLLSYNLDGLEHLADKIAEVKDNAIHSKEYDNLLQTATS